MRSASWKLYFGLQRLLIEEDGQDLVEYALAMLLIVTGVVAGMGSFSTLLVGEYTHINSVMP